MRVSNLKIESFRGIRSGFVRFGKHPVFVGDNNTGKVPRRACAFEGKTA